MSCFLTWKEEEHVVSGEDVIARPFKRVLAALIGVDSPRRHRIAVIVTAVSAAVVGVAAT